MYLEYSKFLALLSDNVLIGYQYIKDFKLFVVFYCKLNMANP